MPTRLSIVIPSHCRADLLKLCLASVLQHAPEKTEILVVDDHSPEETISTTAQSFPGVRVLRMPRQVGFCRAANAGVALARGEVIELLNDDTEVTAGWASAALEVFRDSGIGAVTPLVLMGPPGTLPIRVDSAGDRYHVAGVAGKRGHGEILGPDHLEPGAVFGASGAGAFFRRSALTLTGGFPEEFGAYFDDVDLSFRLHRHGFRIQYEPGSRIHHRVSASHGPPRGDLLAMQSRNEELVWWRNLPAQELLLFAPLHLAAVAGKAWLRLREGKLLPFLHGRCAALLQAGKVIRHRQGMPAATSSKEWQVERKIPRLSGANPGLDVADVPL